MRAVWVELLHQSLREYDDDMQFPVPMDVKLDDTHAGCWIELDRGEIKTQDAQTV